MWPFGKKMRELECRINNLSYEVENLKNILEDADIARFVKIIKYTKGMNLQFD